ncbi:MAG: DUF1194 domain-containing protein [Proteobacteria bacterium]|nr:DUF1194 domain-containing protein [Pseudomonadota bacterium]MDA1057134.1 DUF1194 domain-containing protein [Pseudomonadota bacterium]
MRGLVAIVGLAVWCLAGSPVWAQDRKVDLELILALDSSGSVNTREFNLQLQGYIDAFRNPAVIETVTNGDTGAIAVALLIWAGDRRDGVRVIADWSVIDSPQSADAFVEKILSTPRFILRDGTSLSNVIETGSRMFLGNGYDGDRKVIDISGDGTNNIGYEPNVARDIAIEAGVTINGLAILTDFPDLDLYYGENVVGGPGAFVVSAQNFHAFSAAVLNKLVREISGDTGPRNEHPNRYFAQAPTAR